MSGPYVETVSGSQLSIASALLAAAGERARAPTRGPRKKVHRYSAEISRVFSAKAPPAQAGGSRLTLRPPGATGTPMGALRQFLDILLKPDNIPIAGMLVLVLFFTWVALKQALRNDRLIEEGREDEILKEMQR